VTLLLSGFQAVHAADVIASTPSTEHATSQIAWLDDYHDALDRAHDLGKMTLLWFCDPRLAAESAQFEKGVLQQPQIVALVERHCVAVKLPTDAKVVVDGRDLFLLEHGAFVEMQRMPGLAMVDMTDEQSPLYRAVVSVYPFTREPISAEKLAVMLELPRGTLTQRTLIYAVRTHPEHPASAEGDFSPILQRETESHAAHQASITLQGHHNWESRFYAINAQLPSGLRAQEVCAQSWPGQSLLVAAEECVASWRQSPGHWDAVRQRHVLFGYDMKRGHNGVWYAAGIFARPN
jgi:hypothetical protein